ARFDADAAVQADEDRTKARFRLYRDLMNHARYEEANQQIQAIAQDAINNGQRVRPEVLAGYGTSLASAHLQELRELRRVRQERFLQVLMSVERSHIPFSDEPPVHFPPAAVWRKLTEERKAKYESSGFTDQDENAQRRAMALRKKLQESTKVDIEVNTSLKDALEFFTDDWNVTFVINTAAFKRLDPNLDLEAVTLKKTKFANITRETALRLVLNQIPPEGSATYLIRKDFVEITTNDAAYAEKTIRVYPVADL